MVKGLKARMFIPAHTAATDSIAELAQYNIDKVHEIAAKILEICSEPMCFEDILESLFNEYKLSMNFEQYVLVGSTVRSYFAWLKDSGRMAVEFRDNRMLWLSV